MNASIPGGESSFSERIRYALEVEGKTQTSVQTAMMSQHPDVFPAIFMSRWLNSSAGRPDPNKVWPLAEHLHVEFAWLLTGNGPMRRDGREQLTPAEQAMKFAREHGIREDAWKIAWERNRDRESEMTAIDWFNAIQAEGNRLVREGVPDPAKAAAGRLAISAAKRKKAAKSQKAAAVAVKRPVAEKRAKSAG